jgi:hydrogenase nickel incorporation protein HypA/HybF
MHELSIIQSIVDIAAEQVQNAGASKVDSIELEIGELAGVDWTALDFAWEAGVQQSVLEHAAHSIDKVPGMARCTECGSTFHIAALYDPCPACESYFYEIIKGKELRVKSLTVS